MDTQQRKPRIGLLLIGTERFAPLGQGTERGTYAQRKDSDALLMVKGCQTFADVTFPGVIYSREDVARAIRAFTAESVDCVLACFLSWAEDFAWIRFLRDMPLVPVLFAHVVRDSVSMQDTHDDDAFVEFLCCGGLVGMLEASGDKTRFARPMLETALGTWAEILARTAQFACAAHARARLRDSVIGLLGNYNEVMWSTYVDPYSVFEKIGPELRFLTIAELCDIVEEIPEDAARETMERIQAQYETLPDVTQPQFLASIRASMAMEKQAERHGLDLLVLNDVAPMLFRHVGLRPGFWPTNDQVRALVVPEGDIGGGIAAYVLKLLTGKHVHFIEPFHIDVANSCFAGGHAGPNDYTDPSGKTKIARDVRFAKSNFKYAGAPFAWHVFPTGVMTMLHCSQVGGQFQFVATLVESLPCEHFLATYCHGLFRPIGQTPQALFAKLIDIGVTQHYALVSGDCLPLVEDAAKLLSIAFRRV